MALRHYVHLVGMRERLSIQPNEYEHLRKSLNGQKPIATFFSILSEDHRGKMSFPLSSVVAIEERNDE